MKRFIFSFIIILCLPCISFAHSGRTDSSGGHHDYNNVSGLGSYHYHHGYSAHLHVDGVCPYDDTSNSSGYLSLSELKAKVNSDKEYDNGYDDGYDNGYDCGYDDGYDYGYESGYRESKKDSVPAIAAAFAFPTVIASVFTYRSNKKAHKEERTLFQLQQKRKKEELDLEEAVKKTRYEKLDLQKEFEEEKERIQKEIKSYQNKADNAKQEAEKKMQPYLNLFESRITYQKGLLENLQAERKRLEDLNNSIIDEIEKKSRPKNADLSYLIPEGTIIDSNGYPVEIKPTGYKGDKYLVVINRNSEVYHHQGCHHAWSTNRVNIAVARKTHRPCGACKHLLPDMSWYDKYIFEKEKQK